MYLLVTCLYPVTKLVLNNWLGVTKQGQGSIGGWDGMGWDGWNLLHVFYLVIAAIWLVAVDCGDGTYQ